MRMTRPVLGLVPIIQAFLIEHAEDTAMDAVD